MFLTKQKETAMNWHLLETVALAANFAILILCLGGGLLAVVLVFFGNAIKFKGESSRLIRWPRAIKSFWAECTNLIDIVTSGRRPR